MPIIDYNNPEHTEWLKDAKQIWGIRLHPLGEMEVLDYYMSESGNIQNQRAQLLSIQTEIIFTVILLTLFGRNLMIASKMTIDKPTILNPWCCFIASLSGVIVSLVMLFAVLNWGSNCRIILWALVIGVVLGMLSNSAILLQKLYLVLSRRMWVVYISIPFIFPQIGYIYLVMTYSFFKLDPQMGCAVYYPRFLVWYWLGVNVPLNLLFSVIFCYISYKQYRTYGSEAWKKLARDGIQIMCLALLCSIVVVSIVVTTILLNHCNGTRANSTVTTRRKTQYTLDMLQSHTISYAY
ncbi:hypothetical protein BDF22DRAFT_665060 [Syncephalis plumigaleata]|nr:hypothetical protein BDF22DRAFT_665060 [Syncephalis plumigaleata]